MKKYYNNTLSCLVFITILYFVSLIFFDSIVLKAFQYLVIKNNDSIIIVSSHYVDKYSDYLILFSLFIFIVNYHAKLKNYYTWGIFFKKPSMYLIPLFMIVFILCGGNYFEFYNEKIRVVKWYGEKKEYIYSDIEKVNISYLTLARDSYELYEVRLKDEISINLAEFGIFQKLFYEVDSKIPNSVERTYTRDGYNFVIKEFYLKEIYDYYMKLYKPVE